MMPYPHFPSRQVHCLDGLWDFAWLGEDVSLTDLDIQALGFAEKMPVPGCFDASPAYAGKRGTVAYRTTVRVTPGTAGLLSFGALGMWSRIYVDGEALAEPRMPYSQIDIPVAPADFATREIVVVNDNRFDRERMPLLEQFFDFYAYGGMFRSVHWHELPARALDRVEITPVDSAAGLIQALVRFRDAGTAVLPARIAFDGGTFVPVDLKVQDGVAVLELKVPNPTLWTPESPVLHTLSLRVGEDAIVERFGLRTVGSEGGRITVNGTPVKLLGYCRHEAHPQYGPALPLDQLVQDLQLLRDLGCNFVRGSHYPQDPRFLDLCDELGFLVFEESMGWGQKPEHFTDPAFQRLQVAQTQTMVRKSFNHPCVIIWGFLNEGASNTPESRDLYEQLAGTLRAMDPTRLVTYASMHPFNDLNLDLVDVVSINCYPGWYAQDKEKMAPSDEIVPKLDDIRASLAERGFGDKPFIVSEIGAGAIYGWRDPLNAHWSEEYQEAYLREVCEEVVANDAITGVALWQFCDCRTYASCRALTRPRAFNNKGTLDEYRRPKAAYRVVRSIFRGEG
jgi:beta-glucuronidase